MNKKILFIFSKKEQIEFPQKLLSEYQIKSVSLVSTKKIYEIIIDYKPQLILFDENTKLKYVKYTAEHFKFIPICIIGHFVQPKVLEKFLELNLTILNLNHQPETEIISTIENLLWFSLSKEEFWDEEYKLCRADLLKSKFLFFTKFFCLIAVVLILFFFLPKVYNILAITKPLYNEISLKYISPSDITLLKDKIIITDWTIRNILEFDSDTTQLVKMYVADEQFNAVSLNNNNYFVASSIFSNSVKLFRYPDFSVVISTLTLLGEKTVLALHLTDNNELYVLDNKNTLFLYTLKNNNFVFVSSFTITEFLPIDVYVYNKNVFLLDDKNNIHKIININQKKYLHILLNKFFDPQQIKFVSFAIDKNWIFFVSEKLKKVVKLPYKTVNVD